MRKRKTNLSILCVSAAWLPVSALAAGNAETVSQLPHAVPAPAASNGEVATLDGAVAGTIGPAELMGLEGKSVVGAEGESLGMIASIDVGAEEVELRTPEGLIVKLPSALLGMRGDQVVAPTMSPLDVIAMAETQGTDRELALL